LFLLDLVNVANVMFASILLNFISSPISSIYVWMKRAVFERRHQVPFRILVPTISVLTHFTTLNADDLALGLELRLTLFIFVFLLRLFSESARFFECIRDLQAVSSLVTGSVVRARANNSFLIRILVVRMVAQLSFHFNFVNYFYLNRLEDQVITL